MSATPVLPGRAGILSDRLLVQTAADDAHDLALLADRPGSGLVLTGTNALRVARLLRRAHPRLPILTDRRRYAGRRRVTGVTGVAGFDRAWIETQRELRVASVLTDSGYIGRADVRALRAVLGQAGRAGPDVTAVLPLHADWLHHDLEQLCRLVADHGVPVALVLDRPSDPLGEIKTVYGLTALLGLPVPVALLGGDLSALGALAFGAAWAAFGVRSRPRHLHPVRDGAGRWGGANGSANGSANRAANRAANESTNGPAGGRPVGRVSALVDPALALVDVERIAAAWAATQDDPDWVCDCTVCAGRTMDWMLIAGPLEANTHTVQRLLERRDRLASLPPGSLRRQSWRAQCASAEFQCRAMALAGVSWQVPRYLRHWQRI